MTRAYDAIVIGAGANGLTAAAALAGGGLRVLLLERDDATGGQGRVIEIAPGFRAPACGIDPGWLPPAVARGLGLEGLERAPLEPDLTVVVEPGEFLTLPADSTRASDAIRKHSAKDAARWPAFAARLAKLAGFLEALYQVPSPDIDSTSLADLLPLLGLARKFRGLGREDMIELLRILPMSIQELLDDWFESPSLKAAVAPGGVQDFRQGPRSGGTAFVLLHHLVGARPGAVRGRRRWRAGPDAFTKAAEEVARRRGVTVRTGAAVARIRVRDDAVTGVVLADGEEFEAPRVLSTADPARTLLEWVDPVWLDPEFLHAVRQIRFRACASTVLYALDDLPELPGLGSRELLAGVMTLTPSMEALERAADAAKYGSVSERLHVEITVPTLEWPALAPTGKHLLLARAQYTPYHLRDGARRDGAARDGAARDGAARDGAAWDGARRDALASAVTAAIESVAPCFGSRVLGRLVLTPRDLEERFGLTEGAVTHGEMALDQILFMRPVAGWGRYATPIEGLYLGGAGTHPGPGVLGGPGWLAAQRVLADRRRR